MFVNSYTPYEVEFLSNYEKNCYLEQLKILPDDWYYRHNKILYKYNSLGHRSIELSELPVDYLLFIGCSFTEGIGLSIENTFADIVSKTLNIGYYNAGKGGSGPDFLALTLMALLTKLKNKKPKTIVIQWPSFNRFFKYEHTNFNSPFLYYPSMTCANKNQEQLLEAMIKTNSTINTNLFYRYWLLECLKNTEIEKVFEICIDPLDPISSTENTTIKQINYKMTFDSKNYKELARDLSHPGNIAHHQQAIEILSHLV